MLVADLSHDAPHREQRIPRPEGLTSRTRLRVVRTEEGRVLVRGPLDDPRRDAQLSSDKRSRIPWDRRLTRLANSGTRWLPDIFW